MLEINYTDKTGTWIILGNHVHAPEQSIVNRVRHVCEFCTEREVEDDGFLCMPCVITLGENADRADRINRCDW